MMRSAASAFRKRACGAEKIAPGRRCTIVQIVLVCIEAKKRSTEAFRLLDFNQKKAADHPFKHAYETPHMVSYFKIFASTESGLYKFDYNAPAELYPGRNRKSTKKVSYRRFEKAADAIRFAVEELPELLMLGTCIEIDEQRLNFKDIQALYESEQYPLKKAVTKKARQPDSFSAI